MGQYRLVAVQNEDYHWFEEVENPPVGMRAYVEKTCDITSPDRDAYLVGIVEPAAGMAPGAREWIEDHDGVVSIRRRFHDFEADELMDWLERRLDGTVATEAAVNDRQNRDYYYDYLVLETAEYEDGVVEALETGPCPVCGDARQGVSPVIEASDFESTPVHLVCNSCTAHTATMAEPSYGGEAYETTIRRLVEAWNRHEIYWDLHGVPQHGIA